MATRFANTESSDTREQRRTHLCLAAMIDCQGLRSSARIRDLSSDGARIEMAPTPPNGATVVLSRGSLAAAGTVVWRDRASCGVRFDQRIMLAAWMPRSEPMRTQDHVDQVVRQFRREQAGIAEKPGSSPIYGRIADELDFVARMVDTLHAAVAAEPQMIAKHGDKLGLFEQSLATLDQLGQLLRADDPAGAVQAISRTSLGRRLLRQSI